MIEYRRTTVDDGDSLAKIRVEFLSEANNINSEDEKFIKGGVYVN